MGDPSSSRARGANIKPLSEIPFVDGPAGRLQFTAGSVVHCAIAFRRIEPIVHFHLALQADDQHRIEGAAGRAIGAPLGQALEQDMTVAMEPSGRP
jgi:hypothetical protein